MPRSLWRSTTELGPLSGLPYRKVASLPCSSMPQQPLIIAIARVWHDAGPSVVTLLHDRVVLDAQGLGHVPWRIDRPEYRYHWPNMLVKEVFVFRLWVP
jgi:hypothetical protein